MAARAVALASSNVEWKSNKLNTSVLFASSAEVHRVHGHSVNFIFNSVNKWIFFERKRIKVVGPARHHHSSRGASRLCQCQELIQSPVEWPVSCGDVQSYSNL